MNRVLDTTAAQLEAQLATAQVDSRLPSAVAGVVRDGSLVWSGGRGTYVRRDGDGRPDADTQYKIGSITKTFTAALVLLAREAGELELSDPVSRFLPDGPFADSTLRSLLSHGSGIQAEPTGPWWERSPGLDFAALTAGHAESRPRLRVGERYHYSNVGFALLGEVAARLNGSSWFEAVTQQILAPLGMTRTSYDAQEPCAEGFSVEALTGMLTIEPLQDTGSMAPAGQLWSTVGDLTTWLAALVDPDHTVLSGESIQAMTTPQSGTPEERLGGGYGLGLRIAGPGPMSLIGHSGSMPGFLGGMFIDPETKVGAIVLTNGAYGLDVEAVPRAMIETVLGHEPPLPDEWVPTTSVPSMVRDILGTWYWGNQPFTLLSDPAGVSLRAVGPGRGFVFGVVRADEFVGLSGYHAGETLRVVRTSEGSVSHLDIATFVYTRTPYDPAAPIPGAPPAL